MRQESKPSHKRKTMRRLRRGFGTTATAGIAAVSGIAIAAPANTASAATTRNHGSVVNSTKDKHPNSTKTRKLSSAALGHACSILTLNQARSLQPEVSAGPREDNDKTGSMCIYVDGSDTGPNIEVSLQIVPAKISNWNTFKSTITQAELQPSIWDDKKANFTDVPGIGGAAVAGYEEKQSGGVDRSVSWSHGNKYLELVSRDIGQGVPIDTNLSEIKSIAKQIDSELPN